MITHFPAKLHQKERGAGVSHMHNYILYILEAIAQKRANHLGGGGSGGPPPLPTCLHAQLHDICMYSCKNIQFPYKHN